MDRAVLDLVAFYRREATETQEGREALAKLGITSAETVDHFSLGYASGRALDAASGEQYRILKDLGLAKKRREKFHDCVVVPVRDEQGRLVDLCGLKPYASGLRYVHWHEPTRGLVGIEALKAYDDIFVCDTPFHALHVRQHGFADVVALRQADEIERHLDLFHKHGIERVSVVSRKHAKLISPILAEAGIDVVRVPFPLSSRIVTRKALDAAAKEEPATGESGARLVGRTESQLHFEAGEITFRIDSVASAGLAMRVRVRAELGGASFIDRMDLASASGRRKFARSCGAKLGLPARDVERDVSAVAALIDAMEEEEARERIGAPRILTPDERDTATSVLSSEDVLSYQADALEKLLGFVAEPENKRLALLVAASRLLEKPLGAVARGSASSGKSALMQAVAKTLPTTEVLNLSRLTPKALYFMPEGALEHKLLVCDEYAGLAATEYALRTIMSNQTLSLAITVREGGRVPTTRTVSQPARLAVLVSTTGSINIENLSRMLEFRMDTSPSQTRRVMEAVAAGGAGESGKRLRRLEALTDLNRMLRPCRVTIPFADRLTYASTSVLARRQFAQVVGLISAHAALFQFQRETDEANGTLVVEATKADYEAVYPLLGHVVEHFEEAITPPAMELLEAVEREDAKRITRKEVMDRLGWSYSKAYGTLKELAALDLLVPDTMTNGVLRTYDVAPFFRSERGISRMAAPAEL